MDNKEQGRKSRAAGLRFESKVRKDLEKKSWIVSKWFNNVEFISQSAGRLIPARHKFRGVGIPMSMGTGFPDFVVFSPSNSVRPKIMGVEARSNGYLSKEEKEKCKWLINNHIFGKIFVAKKGKMRGTVEYNEWKIE